MHRLNHTQSNRQRVIWLHRLSTTQARSLRLSSHRINTSHVVQLIVTHRARPLRRPRLAHRPLLVHPRPRLRHRLTLRVTPIRLNLLDYKSSYDSSTNNCKLLVKRRLRRSIKSKRRKSTSIIIIIIIISITSIISMATRRPQISQQMRLSMISIHQLVVVMSLQ